MRVSLGGVTSMTPQEKAQLALSSGAPAKRAEEVRPPAVTSEPLDAHSARPLASPPQSALRADSSSIEEERDPRAWLRRRAKQLRANMTPQEWMIWRLLHENDLVALNWRKQTAFGEYVLDFVSHSARLVVEVDGHQHGEDEQREHDELRTAWLNSQGYRVLRIWNFEARKEQEEVWRKIYAAALETPARARMQRWRNKRMAEVHKTNAQIASSSMEEAPRSGGGGAPSSGDKRASRGSSINDEGAPPQSALRADISS